MFLGSIKRRLHRPREQQIPLERLARLWLEDPRLPVKAQGGSQQELMAWTHEDIASFYAQYVESFLPQTDPARPVIEQLLTILDEHGDCPSTIPDADSGEKHIYPQIPLRDYSLEVARTAFDMIRKGHLDPEMLMGKILIMTLGHQLGMLSDAAILGGTSAKSVLILDPLIRDLPYKEAIVNAIRTFRSNHLKTNEARILRAASSAARKKEIERVEVLSKVWAKYPQVDIDKIKSAISAGAMKEHP